jgi:soluble lytic murein transglycosylase
VPVPLERPVDASREDVDKESGARASFWAESVRRERWQDAAKQIDALPDAERNMPEVLYARARVALAMGEAKLALSRMDGLEAGLPLLAADIQRYRAEAKVVVGPYGEAADYFASKSSPDAMVKAAEGFERAHEPVRARAQCERLLSNERRSRLQEAVVRLIRVRLTEGSSEAWVAAADARWISVHAPDSPFIQDADGALTRLAPGHSLTAQELMTRARVLSDAGSSDEALRVLDRVAAAPAPKVARLDELRERADILYKTRGRSLEASRVLDECAAAGGPHSMEDAFHAARALSRADLDDEAIGRMSLIARHHPDTTWGDEAQYFVPYLHLLHGAWKDAASGFDEYAKRYPNGVERHEALRNRAIAHLMSQNYTTARKLFEQLAAQESDPILSARAFTIAALGALRDGDRLNAVARWSDVARSHPLSWPALVSRTRLAEVGAPVPPIIEATEPAIHSDPFPVSLPPPVGLLHRIGLDTDAEVALEGRESVVSAEAPAGRSLEALCAAYGQIGRAKRRFQITRQIPGVALSSAPNAATRWAWECAYPEPYEDEVEENAGVEASADSLAYAVMRQESNFDPDAVSPAHAVGLMQLIPETAKTLATSLALPYDEGRLRVPDLNIALGVHYLHDLRGLWGGQLPLAIAAYNAGQEAIARWVTRAPGMDLDVFVERIPFAETRTYVGRVMGNFARYEYLKKGEAGVPRLTLAMSSP